MNSFQDLFVLLTHLMPYSAVQYVGHVLFLLVACTLQCEAKT